MLKLEHEGDGGSVSTPAKLNLFLEILGRRDDGYHEIETVMVPLDWWDRIVFRRTDGSDRLISQHPQLPSDDSNLILRAVQRLRRDFDFPTLSIEVDKQLPMGAGLGGGSGNAAGTIRWIQRQFRLPISDAQLLSMAAELGSDCAFFLGSGAALCRGRGEQIVSIKPPLFDGTQPIFVLLLPRLSCSTARVFGQVRFPLTSPLAPISCDFGRLRELASETTSTASGAAVSGSAVSGSAASGAAASGTDTPGADTPGADAREGREGHDSCERDNDVDDGDLDEREAFRSVSPAPKTSGLFNRLQNAALEAYPQLLPISQWLGRQRLGRQRLGRKRLGRKRLGAPSLQSVSPKPVSPKLASSKPVPWMLTGSGSTFFAVINDREEATRFAERAKDALGIDARVVEAL